MSLIDEPPIEWDEEAYATGVEAIDTDHRILIELLNQLKTVIRGDTSAEDVGVILENLVDYTGFHFAREEAVQDATAFPDRARHQALHRNFEQTIYGHRDRYFRERSSVDLNRIYDFLHRWLIEHIQVEDRVLGSHAAGRPEAEEAARSAPVLTSDHLEEGPLLTTRPDGAD